MSPSLDNIQMFLASSWQNAFLVGIPAPAMFYVFIFTPTMKYLTNNTPSTSTKNGQSNLNGHASHHDGEDAATTTRPTTTAPDDDNNERRRPADYYVVVVRQLVIVGIFTSIFFHYVAQNQNNTFDWKMMTMLTDDDDTVGTPIIIMVGVVIVRTVLSFGKIFLTREVLNYWIHRLFHASPFLYRHVHAKHHTIHDLSHDDNDENDDGDWDGIYGSAVDGSIGIVVIYTSFFITPGHHPIVVIPIYFLLVGLFGFSINHCGRDYHISVWNVTLYRSTHHDDHHRYRKGNYSDFLPILDVIFGTEMLLREKTEQDDTLRTVLTYR
mmetsp:Transcript_11308/g.26888  ORF Transcript_11308/g.26888 Transcript_11308/m.26888 type:complete len:324 (+) Transcript_11308:194-1165(+)